MKISSVTKVLGGGCIPLGMALEIHLRSGQIMDIVIRKVWISKFTLFFSDGLALDRFIKFSQKQTADWGLLSRLL